MYNTRHFIGARTTKEAMFKAISTPEGIEKWWSTQAKGIPEAGETLELYFEGITTLKFRYEQIIPNEKLVIRCINGFKSWYDTVLTHDLEEKDGQVFLTHIHSNIDPEDLETLTYFNTKWTVYLLSLKDFLEKGKGTPAPGEVKLYHGD